MINYGKQSIDQDDISAVVETLKSDWLTQGPKVEEFENCLADYCNVKYAIAVSNGTAALHLANLALGVTKKTKVVTTPITFLATANSVVYAGGDPIFSDISNKTFTLDPAKLEEQIKNDQSIRGIINVHLGGNTSNIEEINKIADKYNLWVIEDSCHALGGTWKDKNGILRKVGDCSFSDIATFSFHPVKQITTGEGGAITTNNREIYERLITLRTHGMIKDSSLINNNEGGWYYEMQELGYNYRITDFQAALGIEQLKKSDKWQKMRRHIVSVYDQEFDFLDQITPQNHPDQNLNFSYHLYIIQCEKRLELYNYLKENKINTQVHYIPIHQQPYYKNKFGYEVGDFPNAESYYEKALSLPLYPTLTEVEQERIISIIREFYEKN
ncbi:MAG: UDP-4-amino-4,6-dideoxy-N-acetyl-beta-L-altrosamine transaminase [Dehalococcoidia bacterium]|nr:UDP-4-amino-4,6-dideoxy-N-acetyl-beta-L-altrosamine transaminase [Dehalococcoidia bacterium]